MQVDHASYDKVLPLPWLQASESHHAKRSDDDVVRKMKEYFTEWSLDGILVKEVDCSGQDEYTEIKKSKGTYEYYVPFDVGNITSQLPTICNTYAPLDFYHNMAHFQHRLKVRDNFCVELFALIQKDGAKKKLRLAVVHLRRQNNVVCDLLLVCALSVPLKLGNRTYHPYRTIVEACMAFARGQRLESRDNIFYWYNACRSSAENQFKCKVLTKEATTVLSGSIAHHLGFRFYPGQSHFATFASESLTQGQEEKFIRSLRTYFDPAKLRSGRPQDRPTASLNGDVPVIGPHLWSILTELNAFPSLSRRFDGEEREFTNKERLQAVTSFLRPGFRKWRKTRKRKKGTTQPKEETLRPTGFTHETNYKSIAAAVEDFNSNSDVKHNMLADVEAFVCMQSYMFMVLLLCPGSGIDDARQFYTRIGATSFVGASPDQDLGQWLNQAQSAMSAALDTLAGTVQLLSSQEGTAEERKQAAVDALLICKKIRGGQLQSFPLLMYLD